jgi:anti-sigma factor RsiW
MTNDQQLKLQAFLDGELPEAEARETATWLAQDGDAAALLQELRHTRQALAGFEGDVKLPESREFYWSKIERRIQQLESPAPARCRSSVFAALRRLLMPATAVAVLAFVSIVATRQGGQGGVGEVHATMVDAGAFTYRDQAAGMTLVWLSYPAENDFTNPD